MIIENISLISQRLNIFGLPIVWIGVSITLSAVVAFIFTVLFSISIGGMCFLLMLFILLGFFKVVFAKDLLADKKFLASLSYSKKRTLRK